MKRASKDKSALQEKESNMDNTDSNEMNNQKKTKKQYSKETKNINLLRYQPSKSITVTIWIKKMTNQK